MRSSGDNTISSIRELVGHAQRPGYTQVLTLVLGAVLINEARRDGALM